MNDNQLKVWGYLKAWYNIEGSEFEKRRFTKLMDDYEKSIPERVKTVVEVKEVRLRPVLKDKHSLKDIEAIVCAKYAITKRQLRYDSLYKHYAPYGRRSEAYVDARQDFALMAYADGYTFVNIAIYLGYKNHTSVLNLVRKRPERSRRAV